MSLFCGIKRLAGNNTFRLKTPLRRFDGIHEFMVTHSEFTSNGSL